MSLKFKSPVFAEGFTAVPNLLWKREDLSAPAKLLFVVIQFHAYQKGRAWPGQPTLAAESGMSESSVKRALKELEATGLVSVLRRPNKQNVYEVHPEALLGQEWIGHIDLPNPDGEVNMTSEEEEGTTTVEEEPPVSPPRGDVERVWNHYCSMPGKRVRELPKQERKVILAALEVATADELVICINECWKSDFHMKRREHQDRPGQRYDKLTQIIKGRQGKETTRERIDFWLERAETTGVAGSGIPSADPAVIARRKQDVQRGHRLAGDPQAVRKAQEAEAWLRKYGIVTIRGEDGYPSFQDASLAGV